MPRTWNRFQLPDDTEGAGRAAVVVADYDDGTPVAWEVAEDANMRTVVARGVEQAAFNTLAAVASLGLGIPALVPGLLT
ncbi:UNVERIFIED_ORG: phosphodiesterase/alkaline phosphatase D-like protein [Arthrobacter sp. UYEF13]